MTGLATPGMSSATPIMLRSPRPGSGRSGSRSSPAGPGRSPAGRTTGTLAPSASRSAWWRTPAAAARRPRRRPRTFWYVVGGQFRRCEVAQVLVDPVGRQRADHPLLPPVGACMSGARPPRCSSRRARRGRRRSSRSAPWTAASARPDPSTIRHTATCIPRSRRPAPSARW